MEKMEINGIENGAFTKRVLVTGGAGFLGSTLVPMLLHRRFEVVVYDKFMWGAVPLAAHVSNPKLEIVRGDILDKKLLGECMFECDSIIHLAALVVYPACDKLQEEAVKVCLQACRVFMRRAGARQYSEGVGKALLEENDSLHCY